jgi:geranylgeranyl diphosphate synthase type I
LLALRQVCRGKAGSRLPALSMAKRRGPLPPVPDTGAQPKKAVLFQIRDDELGLFGDEQVLGKSVGSDVREGKKTLFFAGLLRRSSREARARLTGIFGNPGIGAQEIAFVREELERSGVRGEVAALAAAYEEEARRLIGSLPEGRAGERQVLADLLKYTQDRTR